MPKNAEGNAYLANEYPRFFMHWNCSWLTAVLRSTPKLAITAVAARRSNVIVHKFIRKNKKCYDFSLLWLDFSL